MSSHTYEPVARSAIAAEPGVYNHRGTDAWAGHRRANTAVFSVVNVVLLRPLSYRDPDRIVTLSNFSSGHEAATALSEPVSIPDFQDWQDQSSSFEAMAYYSSRETAVIRGSTAEYARVTSVSPEFFRVFAIEPLIAPQE